MKRLSALFLVLTFAGVALSQDAPIRNFLRVNEQFCTAGQPTIEQLAKLKADGNRAVLNLRQPSEHDAAAEEAKVKELGLKYFNIPVAPNTLREDQVAEFLRLTDDPQNRPMFIHCGSASRVGGFWMIRRVLRDGWKVADAEAEAAKIGLSSAVLKDLALKYIESHKK